MIRYGIKVVRDNPDEPGTYLSQYPGPAQVIYRPGHVTQALPAPLKDGYGLALFAGLISEPGIPLAVCWNTWDEMSLPPHAWMIERMENLTTWAPPGIREWHWPDNTTMVRKLLVLGRLDPKFFEDSHDIAQAMYNCEEEYLP